MQFIDRIVEVLVVLPRLVALIRSKQTVFPRHSSGVSGHISPLPATSTGPLPSKCHEACTAIPGPILAATGARDSESTENLGGPLVQCIVLLPSRVDILALVFQRQVPTIQTVQKTVEVLETQHTNHP